MRVAATTINGLITKRTYISGLFEIEVEEGVFDPIVTVKKHRSFETVPFCGDLIRLAYDFFDLRDIRALDEDKAIWLGGLPDISQNDFQIVLSEAYKDFIK